MEWLDGFTSCLKYSQVVEQWQHVLVTKQSTAFSAMRIIVTIGWAIYPLGYIFGYLTGGVDANALNVIYNLADFVNKIAFGLVIWATAMQTQDYHLDNRV